MSLRGRGLWATNRGGRGDILIIAQAGDNEATEAALALAFEAIRAGRHKEKALAPKYGKCCKSSTSRGTLLFMLRFTAAWVYTAMTTLGVSWLEKQRRYKEAVNLLHELLGSIPLHPRHVLSFFFPSRPLLCSSLRASLFTSPPSSAVEA